MSTSTMGEKIKMLREANNMTLEQVGNIVGVGKSTVRKWETGAIANMRRDKIAKLAQALKTTPAYLMGWTDNDFEKEYISSKSDSDPYKPQLDECYDRLNDSGKKEACRRVSELTEIPRYITPQSEESTGKLAIVAMGGDGVKFIKTTKEADEEVKRILKEMWDEEENKQ